MKNSVNAGGMKEFVQLSKPCKVFKNNEIRLLGKIVNVAVRILGYITLCGT